MSQGRFGTALSSAAMSARAAARTLEGDAASMLLSARAARRSEAGLRRDAASLLAGPTWATRPLLRPVWKALKGAEAARRSAALTARADAWSEKCRDRMTRRAAMLSGAKRALKVADGLASAAAEIGAIREPAPLPPAIQAALAMLARAAKKGSRDIDGLVAAAGAAIAAARWLKSAERPAPAAGAAPPATAPHDVYLPVPYATGKFARRLGAAYDTEAERGSGSRFFVPAGTPLAPFESFLPLAYRGAAPRLHFPPVRHGASGQNLWTLFDRQTWDQIRHINYERTGRRCVLCGGQSGALLRALGDRNGGGGQVECHEVWEWKVPDPEVSLGIQRLRGMLVLCHECHLTFHDGHSRRRARELGMEDEVRRFLMKRRSFIVRKPVVEVAREMAEDARILRSHSGVKAWIVDLTHLGRQDYMRHVDPVFVEKNAAGVDPGLMAGLSFRTDAGTRWPAATAREVYGTLSDLYRAWPEAARNPGRHTA